MALILVVDDESDILAVVSLLLKIEGYEVETAVDGAQALKIAQTRPVDLILTDWMMPKMDGIELCRLMRSDIRTSTIPIIVHSAAGLPPDKAALFDAALSKPTNIDRLLKTIQKLLQGS